jgi:hypothetical protein
MGSSYEEHQRSESSQLPDNFTYRRAGKGERGETDSNIEENGTQGVKWPFDKVVEMEKKHDPRKRNTRFRFPL